ASAAAGDGRVSPSRDAPPIWISEAIVDLYHVKLGDSLTAPLNGTPVRFTVAGIWRDYARSNGAPVISRAGYARLSGGDRAGEAWLWLEPGGDIARVEQAARAVLRNAPPAEAISTRELRERSLSIFDRAFAVTYALEILATVIGLAGIGVAASSTALSRRAE